MWIEVGNEMVNFNSFESLKAPRTAFDGWVLEAVYKKNEYNKKSEIKNFYFDEQKDCEKAYDSIRIQLRSGNRLNFLE